MMNPNWNTVHVAAWSVDKGLLREHNEDSVAAVDFDLVNNDVIHSVGIYAIADGMGGKEQGEVASKMAAQTAVHQIIQYLMQPDGVLPQDYAEWVAGAVEAANSAVYHTSSDMATTLLLAVVIDNQAHIANVGDTRAYIVTRQEIYQITEDQSFVQELVKAGAITHSQAARHPQRHLLNQAVGLKDTVNVDTFNVVFPTGAYLLLCSDGLTNELSDAMIHSVITQADSPQSACDGLVSEANRSGGRDNISVVLVQLH